MGNNIANSATVGFKASTSLLQMCMQFRVGLGYKLQTSISVSQREISAYQQPV
nr:hypothetical protein [Paenalcaligenes hominis]